MDTQFKVTFIETYGAVQKTIPCDHFHRRMDQNYLVDEVQLMENSVLQVLFEAPMGYRLYMDGLDQLEEEFVLEDENGLYINPSTEPYVLYNPERYNKPYPFIPGTYFLMISTDQDEVFEARAKVMTKRISEDQHVKMIEEIEKEVRGLASELTSRRKIFSEVALDIFGPEKIEEYSIILSRRDNIINGLNIIEKNRRYSVIKSYPVIPKAKAKKIDSRSIKYLMMHPEQQKTIQAPVSTVTYDIAENRMVKKIVLLILKYVNEMRNCFLQPYVKTNNVAQADLLKKEIIILQNRLTLFLNEKWIRNIPESVSGDIPMAFFSVGTYNTFYKIYRMLRKGPAPKANAPKLQFHYKRSDLLYEIWGYLQIVKILKEEHGFEIKRNWFQINQNTLDQVIVPRQHGSDYIELCKGNKMIRIFYDEILPKKKSEISPLSTMHTWDHNRPDCRVDVWVDEKYKGSLIIDFKYRKKEYLWNDDLLENRQPSKVMRQLRSYSSGMKSHTTLLNGEKNPLTDAQPVTEVWAVYPIKRELLEVDYDLNEYDVRLIDLSPDAEKGHFSNMLDKAIQEIIQR